MASKDKHVKRGSESQSQPGPRPTRAGRAGIPPKQKPSSTKAAVLSDPDRRSRHSATHAKKPPGLERGRHDRSRRDAKEKTASRVQLTLMDLDQVASPVVLGVQRSLQAYKLDEFLRKRSEDRNRPIPSRSRLCFYSDGRLLAGDHSVGEGGIIWYRVTTAAGDDLLPWRITHWQDETNGQLERALVDELAHAIDNGATIGQLRGKIAAWMDVGDANRVVLTAKDGMRPGLLQGNAWEARQVRKWLCRWLSIDVTPESGYVVLRGLGRDYIYHPPQSHLEAGMEVKDLKWWTERRLLKTIHQQGRTALDFGWPQIVLTRDGYPLGAFSQVCWGSAYDFEVPGDVAELIAAEEAWLLTVTETCTVCSEDRKLSDLPVRICARCDHRPTLCKDCLAQWLQSSLETSTWDRLKCPECPLFLQYEDVRRYAAKPVFERYDVLAMRAAVKDIAKFRWCLSPACESGQIHDAECPEFKCKACRARHCVTHNIPWHKGETCAEYDIRNQKRVRDEQASEDAIKRTSKKCPECQRDVHKWTGCNHITCVCRHEWCYICLAPYQRNQHGFLFCRHNLGCTEQDPFADLVDPQPGRRPWPHWGFPPHPGARPPPPGRPRPWRADGNPAGPPPPPPFQRPRAPFFFDEEAVEFGDEEVGDNARQRRRPPHVPPPPFADGQRRRDFFVGAAAVGMAAAAAAAAARRQNRAEQAQGRRPNLDEVTDMLDQLRELRL